MLAEPRRRQKWSLNPRGNLWSNDESKFGQKLMEKMGWKSGGGLGAQSQGMTDPISLNANQEKKGLGHTGGDDDVWLNHKDNFDDVLASLNSEFKGANDEEIKVSSLRDVSKRAKKRVHYEKFTKGKDLSGYSQTDLSCILGTEKRKKRKKQEEEEESAKPSLNVEVKAEDDEGKVETFKDTSGLVVIQGGSINDYFKMKMQQINARRKAAVDEVVAPGEKITKVECHEKESNGMLDSTEPERKKKKAKRTKNGGLDAASVEGAPNTEIKDTTETQHITETEQKTKKKKSKRKEPAEPVKPEEAASETEDVQKPRKKKSKKRSHAEKDVSLVDLNESSSKKQKKDKCSIPPEENIEPKKSKKKCKKSKQVGQEADECIVKASESQDAAAKSTKKKKKSKREKNLPQQRKKIDAADVQEFKGASLNKIKGYGK